MENRNRTMDLVIDWDKHEYAIKDQIRGEGKEKVKEALLFGKMVAVKHYNHKAKKVTNNQLAFYANNTLVYVSRDGCPRQEGDSRDGWVYEIQGVHFVNNTEVPDEVTIDKMVSFQDNAHVSQQSAGRAISLREIYHTLKEGAFVSDHTVTKRGYVYYDRYYFCNDVCVLARETKHKFIVSTTYKITPAGDTNFFNKLSKYVWGLKNQNDESDIPVNFFIKNETAEKQWHNSKEYWDLVMLNSIEAGNADASIIPGSFERRLRFNNLYFQYHSSEQSRRLLKFTTEPAAIMKLVEFGGTPYHWKGGEGYVTFRDFHPMPGQEYSFGVVIKSEEDSLSKRQKRYLKLLGFDLEKYDYDRQYKDGEITLIFSMQNYSVNSNPWAHNNWEAEESA